MRGRWGGRGSTWRWPPENERHTQHWGPAASNSSSDDIRLRWQWQIYVVRKCSVVKQKIPICPFFSFEVPSGNNKMEPTTGEIEVCYCYTCWPIEGGKWRRRGAAARRPSSSRRWGGRWRRAWSWSPEGKSIETTVVDGHARGVGEGPDVRGLLEGTFREIPPLREVAAPGGLRGRSSWCGGDGPLHWISSLEKSLMVRVTIVAKNASLDGCSTVVLLVDCIRTLPRGGMYWRGAKSSPEGNLEGRGGCIFQCIPTRGSVRTFFQN